MLVHICCSVDSFYYLSRLKEKYPNEPLIGFFDNPNIHPYSEYLLRKVDAQRSCDYFGIPFLEGDYDVEQWLQTVRGYENEPEKGSRCLICFDDRLEATCRKACEVGETKFTTTLLMSPQKDHEQLKAVARFLKNRYDVTFVFDDFRTGGGTQAQRSMSKELKAYHQDYCGCLFALEQQRLEQGAFLDEMISSVYGQPLLASIDERLALYEKRFALEREGKPYEISQQLVLNYRLLRGGIIWDKIVQPSYILIYSSLSHPRLKGDFVPLDEGYGTLSKGDVLILGVERFASLVGINYRSIDEIFASPPSVEQEISVREKLGKSLYSLTPIVIVSALPVGKKVELFLESKIYQDTREVLSY